MPFVRHDLTNIGSDPTACRARAEEPSRCGQAEQVMADLSTRGNSDALLFSMTRAVAALPQLGAGNAALAT